MDNKVRIVFVVLISLLICNCVKKEILPQHILAYTLVKVISGSEATQMVNRLHLQPVTDSKNEIGFYESETKQAIIYVTYYQSEMNAKDDLIKMVDKISPENSVFINGGQLESNNITVYRYFGMGQTHFIFRYRQMLFWLSVETMIAKEFLYSYIKYLQ